jgi:signal transduction histidine kinase
MVPADVAALVNLVGFLAGAALYGMLLGMVVGGRLRGVRLASQADGLPLAAAVLGLTWNLGELALQALREWAGVALGWPMNAAAFTALGFLPSVTIHTVLRSPACVRGRASKAVIGAAYALSAFAALAHLAAGLELGVPSPLALRMLAVGFMALVPVVVAVTPGAGGLRRSAVWAIALLTFAASAFHLSVHTPAAETLSSALYGHHASLPLVLAILFQDYRFALADVFLKRAASLLLLSALALGLYLGVVTPLLTASGGAVGSGVVVVVVSLWVATALLYPLLRRAVARLVDRVLLERPDYGVARAVLASKLGRLDSPEQVMRVVSESLRSALRVPVNWRVAASGHGAVGNLVPVETTEPPQFELVVGPFAEGRRLLSDDEALLDACALLAARRIDALRLAHERCQRDLREQEMGRLATEAELRALRAQLNPHFLFNALTTLGYLMRAAPERALETLLQLTALLRAVLKRCDGDLVTLGQELDLVEAYLGIESARFEERLRVSIDAPRRLRAAPVPPLVLQPLVENAIKHGIAPRREGGEIRIRAESGGRPERLRLSVSDTGVGATDVELRQGRRGGVGLANIEKRLAAYYGAEARLSVESRRGLGTSVSIELPLAAIPAALPEPRHAGRPA